MEVAAFANVQLPSDLDHFVPELEDLLEWPYVNPPDVVEFNPQELALVGFDFSHIRPVDEDLFMEVITTDPAAPVTKINVFDDTEGDVTPPADSPADASPQESSPADVPKSDSSADVFPQEGSPADVSPQENSPADVSPQEGSPADVPKSDSSADVTPQEGSPADVIPKADMPADVPPQDVKIKFLPVFTYVITANHPLHRAISMNLLLQRLEASDPSLAPPLKIPIEHKNQVQLELSFSSSDDDEKQTFQQCRMSNCTNRNHPRFCFTILGDNKYPGAYPPVYNYYCCHLYKTQIDPLPTDYRFTLKMERWQEIDLHSLYHRIISAPNPLDYDPSHPSAFLLLRKFRGKTKVPDVEAFEVLGALRHIRSDSPKN